MIRFELPYPPSINHYYRRVGPRTLISREGRAYRGHVASALAGLGLEPFDGPLEVQLDVYPPDKRRRDVDNVQKALLDSLQQAGVYRDDSQIKRLVTEMLDVVPGGKVAVTIGRYQRHDAQDEREILAPDRG